jgi:hypothetical protein
MTKIDWLSVAMIMAVIITAAATLLGPVLAVYVQVRMSQPKPTPDVNQPIAQKGSRFKRLLLSSAPSYFFIVAFLLLLLIFARMPVSRLSVLIVALTVSSLTIQFMGLALQRLVRNVSELNTIVSAQQITLQALESVLGLTRTDPPTVQQ